MRGTGGTGGEGEDMSKLPSVSEGAAEAPAAGEDTAEEGAVELPATAEETSEFSAAVGEDTAGEGTAAGEISESAGAEGWQGGP
jgi:hypothetical protein